MKFSLDRKMFHIRLHFSTGFAAFIIKKAIKKYAVDELKNFKAAGKRIKKLLKEYRRKYGPLTLLEIDSKDMKISLRL